MINSIEETKQNANKKKQEFDAKTNDEWTCCFPYYQ